MQRNAGFFKIVVVVISISLYFLGSFSSFIVFRGQKNLQNAQGRDSSTKKQKTSLKISVNTKKKNKSSKYSSSVWNKMYENTMSFVWNEY